MATIEMFKNVEDCCKKPHKNDFFHIFHIFILKMWRIEPLVYKDNSAFSTFLQFPKCF
jgi:hypothetical protein